MHWSCSGGQWQWRIYRAYPAIPGNFTVYIHIFEKKEEKIT
jgi:hypothetical protein